MNYCNCPNFLTDNCPAALETKTVAAHWTWKPVKIALHRVGSWLLTCLPAAALMMCALVLWEAPKGVAWWKGAAAWTIYWLSTEWVAWRKEKTKPATDGK